MAHSKIFSVEGNIGSGKSTLVQYMKEHEEKFKRVLPQASDKEFIFIREPVDSWSDIKDKSGETILSKFYANPKKYSFSFQIMAYISRLALLRETVRNNPGKIIVTERCVNTDKNVFAQMLYDDGNIEEVDYQIYLRWFDEFIEDFPISGYIYVNTPPELCAERIKIRNREGEVIPLEYLQRCHKYHEEWLNQVNKNIYLLDGKQKITSDQYDLCVMDMFHFISTN